jgi:hypothetical protein
VVWWVGGVQFRAEALGFFFLREKREKVAEMDEEDYYRLQRQSGREMEQDCWERASILYRPGDRVSSERGGEGGRGEK